VLNQLMWVAHHVLQSNGWLDTWIITSLPRDISVCCHLLQALHAYLPYTMLLNSRDLCIIGKEEDDERKQ